MKKEIKLQVRITKDLKDELDIQAQKKHISVSDYVRYLIIKEIENKK